MVMNCSRSVTCRSGAGPLKFKRMVLASTTVQSCTKDMVGNTFLPSFGSAAFLRLAATASALNGLPEWNLTPWRNVSVTDLLSGAIWNAVARLG